MEGLKKGNHHDQTKEEEDLLHRRKKRNKGIGMARRSSMEGADIDMADEGKNTRSTYKDAAMGFKGKSYTGTNVEIDKGAISNDDVIEESTHRSWFGIGMIREEKWRVRQPWWKSLIVKLVGRYIGYHYLWCRIQALWRKSVELLLIDLGNEFYIVKLFVQEEYERAMTEGP